MKNNQTYWLSFLWLIAFFVSGCSQKKDTVIPATDSNAMAGNWILIEPISAYSITLSIKSTTPQLAGFYSLQLMGRSAVNAYFATANFSQGPSIESGEAGTGGVSGIGATKMAGPPEAMRVENDYFTKLAEVNRAELVGIDRLGLSYGGLTPGVLVYKRQ